MRKLVLFAVTVAFATVVPFIAEAAEITFSGTIDKDLAKAGNWPDSTLPTAEDTIVLPINAVTTYELSANLAVKGIKADPYSSFTIQGEGTLSIGANGMLINRDKAYTDGYITLRVPVVTTADQIWDMRGRNLNTYNTISGTSKLVVSNMYTVSHQASVGYSGRIEYHGEGYKNCWANYFATGTWSTGDVYFRLCRLALKATGVSNFSDIFKSGNKVVQDGWGSSGVQFGSTGNTVNYGSGNNLLSSGDGDYFYGTNNFTGGIMELKGIGTIYDNARVNISGDYDLTMNYGLALGPGTVNANIAALVNQNGGKVKIGSYVLIGGCGGNGCASMSEWRVNGGYLKAGVKSETDTAKGIHLPNSYSNGGGDPCAGVFTQTGGTTECTRVSFGSSKSYWDNKVNIITNGFGLLSVEGGLFNLGLGRFGLGTSWNAITNKEAGGYMPCPWAEGRYRVRLSGGTIKPYYDSRYSASYSQNVQWDVAPGSGITFDGSEISFTQSAPLWGEGTFIKSGKMRGNFIDLSRFTGKLVLAGGTNSIEGVSIPTGKYDTDCVIFRADDAAEGKADGAEVASWTDSKGTKSATTLSGVYSPATNCCLNPTVKLNDFNGHAGLKFATSGAKVTALALPTADNPLVGCNDFTVAVVFKTTLHGACSSGWDYQYAYSTGILGTSVTYGNNGMGIAISGDDSNIDLALAGRSFDSNQSGVGSGDKFTRTRSAPYRCNDGKVHVFVYSSSGQLVTSSLDGWCAESNRGKLDTTKKYLIGCSQFSTTAITAPFMIGVINAQVWNLDNKATPNRAFVGTMAEIRIYPNRFMTTSEMNALAYELNQKYNPEAKNADAFMRFANRGVCGTWTDVKDSAVALPAGAVEFVADSLTGIAEGSEVTSWTSSTSASVVADSTTGGGEKGPTLVKSASLGKSFLRFTAADKTALGIPSASSPLTGASSYALAVVFRTTTDGVSANVYRNGRGLVSTIQNTTAVEDTCIALHEDGVIMTGVGAQSGGVSKYTRKPCRLADGQVHVAILNADLTNDTLTQMVDGFPQYQKSLTTTATRPDYDLLIGSLCKEKDGCYFDGEIAAVAIWDKALTRAEMDQVTTHYAQEYSFYPLAKGLFSSANLTERGIAAKEIVVEDGAALILAESAASPFTLKSYQTVTGDGRVFGSVRWGENAVYDTDAAAKDIDDVQLASAKLKFAAGSLPFENAKISSISGSMKLDVSAVMTGSPALRTTLMNVAPGVVKDGTTFEIIGGPMSSRAYYDNGKLILHSPRGSVILLR